MSDADFPTAGESEASVSPLDSELASFAGQLHVPKPSADQAIVWLALTVVLIALQLVMSAVERGVPKHFPPGSVLVVLPWWRRVLLWLSTPSFAACLVASGVLIRSKCLRMLDRLQPGHWIVLILATVGIFACVARSFYFVTLASHKSLSSAVPALNAISFLLYVVSGSIFLLAAIRVRDAVRWKVLLVSGAIDFLFWSVPFMPSWFRRSSRITERLIVQVHTVCLPWCLAIVAIIAVIVLALDWPQRARRDWVHWLGASLWTLGAIATVIVNWHLFMR
jgi:hypothetical protein